MEQVLLEVAIGGGDDVEGHLYGRSRDVLASIKAEPEEGDSDHGDADAGKEESSKANRTDHQAAERGGQECRQAKRYQVGARHAWLPSRRYASH